MKSLTEYLVEGTYNDKIEYYRIKNDTDKELLALSKNYGYTVSPETIISNKFYIPKDNVTEKELRNCFNEQTDFKNIGNLDDETQNVIDALNSVPMMSFFDKRKPSCIMKNDEWYNEEVFDKSSRLTDARYHSPSEEISKYIDTWISVVEKVYPAKKRMTLKQIEKSVHDDLMKLFDAIPNPLSAEERNSLRNDIKGLHKEFRRGEYR